jgi:hypothetical protein
VIYLGRSIALFPFWRFDAKGGEVVLLGLSVWDLHGFRAQAYAFTILIALVSIYVKLCVSMSNFVFSCGTYVCLSYETYGFLIWL